MNPIEKFYDDNVQQEWARLAHHRTEFALTQQALAEFLPKPPGPILDIGGGPGRYALSLAEQGYAVTLVDLSQKNLTFAQQQAQARGLTLTDILQANGLDLAPLPRSHFAAALLLGPLYHLLTHAERRQAVLEAKRTLQPGGYIFAAFITRFASLRAAAKHDPHWIITHAEAVEQIFQTGVYQVKADVSDPFTEAYFAHPAEIEPFMAELGFTKVFLLGCEGLVAGNEEKINQLEGDAWERWVALNYRLGQEASLHGASDHLLYVGHTSTGSESG
jgi:SAM-dependent methyltransferase